MIKLETAIILLTISANASAQMRLTETGGGIDTVSLQASTAIATTYSLTLPGTSGAANQCFATDGAGTLQWRATSNKAYALDASDGSPTNALYVAADGHVGIGNTNPGFDVLFTSGQFGFAGDVSFGAGAGQFVEFDVQSGTASYFGVLDGGVEILRLPTGLSTGAGNFGIYTSSPQAKLEVRGEIQTTSAPGVGRIWGRGRPGSARYGTSGVESGLCTNGSISFGLSYSTTSWNTAEAVCPLGTWVCTAAERGIAACNTSRPDGSTDGAFCTGSAADYAANAHYGWTATPGGYLSSGFMVMEDGSTANTLQPCSSMPVWCCK